MFKINVSHKGKAYKVETENEWLVGKKIGEKIDGSGVDDSLKGYELEITGTSDLSGIPGFKGLEGSGYHRQLLTYGPGMKDTSKGLRLRKSNRGEEISLKTHQVNIKVLKEGETGFGELGDSEGDGGETVEEVKSDTSKEETKVEEKKEEVKEEKGE
jgi:ribosomal protein S6E (S10)